MWKRLCHDQDGQDVVEYALLVGLIVVTSFGAVAAIPIGPAFSAICTKLVSVLDGF